MCADFCGGNTFAGDHDGDGEKGHGYNVILTESHSIYDRD